MNLNPTLTQFQPNLKPCPFCGKDAAVLVEQRNLFDEVRWCVYCTYCGATQENFKYETKLEAAREWNRRATDGKA